MVGRDQFTVDVSDKMLYRNKIEEALKSGNIRNIPQAGPSTSQGTSITTTSEKFK